MMGGKFRNGASHSRAAGRGTGQKGSCGKFERPGSCRFRPGAACFKAAGAGAGCEPAIPETAAEWASAFPGVTTPSYLWPLEESGVPMNEAIAGVEDFVLGGAGNFDFQVSGDPIGGGRVGVRAQVGSSNLRIGLSTVLNVTTAGIVSFICRFAEVSADPTLYRAVIGKRPRTTNGAGYRVSISPVTGHLRLEARDGTSAVNATIAIDHSAGTGWHYIGGVVDRSAQLIRLYSDANGSLNSAQASISLLGTFNNAIRFHLGDSNGVETDPGSMWSYAAAWSGVSLTEANFREIMGL